MLKWIKVALSLAEVLINLTEGDRREGFLSLLFLCFNKFNLGSFQLTSEQLIFSLKWEFYNLKYGVCHLTPMNFNKIMQIVIMPCFYATALQLSMAKGNRNNVSLKENNTL